MKHIQKKSRHIRTAIKNRQSPKIILIFLLVLTLPVLVFAINQKTEIRQRAAGCLTGETCMDAMACSNSLGSVDKNNACVGTNVVCCIKAGAPTPVPPANNPQVYWSCATKGTACVQVNTGGTGTYTSQSLCNSTCAVSGSSTTPIGTVTCGTQQTGRCYIGACPDPNYPVPVGSDPNCTNAYKTGGICCNTINGNNLGNGSNPCSGLALNPQCGLNNGGTGLYCGNNSACIAGGADGELYTCKQTGPKQYITVSQTACTNADCRIAIGANNPDYCGSGGGPVTKPIIPGTPVASGLQCDATGNGYHNQAGTNVGTCASWEECKTINGGAYCQTKTCNNAQGLCTDGLHPKCKVGSAATTFECGTQGGLMTTNQCCPVDNVNNQAGLSPHTPIPPVTCTCDNSGHGAPFNHYTCSDTTKSANCATDAICNGAAGSDPSKMCTHNAQLKSPVCTCNKPGDLSDNTYLCTNDDNVRNCGKNDQGPYTCKDVSTAPKSPCNGPNTTISLSTQNTPYLAGIIDALVKPLQYIDVNLHFLKMAGNNPQTPPTADTVRLYYDATSKTYTNHNFDMNNVKPGSYLVFVKADGYLVAQLKDENGSATFTIDPKKNFYPQKFHLIPGDVAPSPHGDNFIDIYDYNYVLGCYGKQPVNDCKHADLNNDGKVDDGDAEIIVDRFWKFGDSYTEPNFTCVSDPNCKSGVGSLQLCSLKCTKNIDF